MKLEIYCDNKLVNVSEDNESAHATLTSMLYSIVTKNTQHVTKMKGDYGLEYADLSFTLADRGIGDYVYKFVDVPIAHGYMNTYELVYPKED